MVVGVVSAVVEEGQRHVAEPVVGLERDERTLSVSATLGLHVCEMLAADVGKLGHEGVSGIPCA